MSCQDTANDRYHLFPAKITLGRTCTLHSLSHSVLLVLKLSDYLSKNTRSLEFLTDLLFFVLILVIAGKRLAKGKLWKILQWWHIHYSSRGKGSKFKRLYIYSLGISHNILEGESGNFQKKFLTAKTAEKMSCTGSRGVKVERELSTIQLLLIEKWSCASYCPPKRLILSLTSLKIAHPLPLKILMVRPLLSLNAQFKPYFELSLPAERPLVLVYPTSTGMFHVLRKSCFLN